MCECISVMEADPTKTITTAAFTGGNNITCSRDKNYMLA